MKNSIELTQEQREQLEGMISCGKATARKIQHARILLKIDSGKDGPGWSDEQIKVAYGASSATVWRIRQRFLEHGMDNAINRRPQPERPEKRRVTGEQEAQLIVLACEPAPTGHSHRTIRLLREKMVELEIVEEVGRETIASDTPRGKRAVGLLVEVLRQAYNALVSTLILTTMLVGAVSQ